MSDNVVRLQPMKQKTSNPMVPHQAEALDIIEAAATHALATGLTLDDIINAVRDAQKEYGKCRPSHRR